MFIDIAMHRLSMFFPEFHGCLLIDSFSKTGNKKENTAQKAPKKLKITRISG
jgi:hypothetical protein